MSRSGLRECEEESRSLQVACGVVLFFFFILHYAERLYMLHLNFTFAPF